MKASTFKFILLFAAQLILWNYCNFSQYLIIVFLPAMLLCLPIDRGVIRVMILAFLLGLAADFFETGQLGLTSLALVPVAAIRRWVIQLVFGNELLARGEDLSFRRQGLAKFVTSILILTSVFLLIYLWVDSAGMYPLGFLALKYGISLLVSTVVSLAIAFLLLEESVAKWN